MKKTRLTMVSSAMTLAFGWGLAPVPLAAQSVPLPPDTVKTVVIKNNSTTRTIYPVISTPKRLDLTAADLWMQAKFGIASSDANTRTFRSNLVYRAYINLPTKTTAGGVPPGGTATVRVPFYTQLQPVTPDNLGKTPDQFIDWWNAVRVYIFPDRASLEAALNTYDSTNKPYPIPNASIPRPTCTNTPATPGGIVDVCNVSILAHNIDPLGNIPFELAEYTFADASGPPPNGNLPVGSPFTISETNVNYDVSSLDSVYLPVAMGPFGNSSVPYVGTQLTVEAFNAGVASFYGNNGSGWPRYVPTYFQKANNANFPKIYGQTCSLAPFTGMPAYLQPKLPGAYNLINVSYQGYPAATGSEVINPPIPPLLSSQPSNYPTNGSSASGYKANQCVSDGIMPFLDPTSALGTNGQAMVNLWKNCTDLSNVTCQDIKIVRDFFVQNFHESGCPADPDWVSTYVAVLGWVPIKAPLYSSTHCGGTKRLADTAGYPDANRAYCRLQYNYLTVGADSGKIFNPYVKLIHQTLQSSAYAFSIDDKSAYKGVPGNGVIIAVGGVKGLENTTPSPLPTAATIFDFCKVE